jgi:hypothetical protein
MAAEEAMGHGYTELRIRQNRELVKQHPRWRHVHPERLWFPPRQTSYDRYETAVTDARRHLQQAEELFRRHDEEER